MGVPVARAPAFSGSPVPADQRLRRILAVGNMYPPHHAGGYELAWQQAMEQARSDGHAVRVLTTDYRRAMASGEEDPDVHRILRWYWDLDRYEFPALRPQDRLRIERHNATALKRQLAEFKPDVVTWWSMGCMSLGLIEQVRRHGAPMVFVVHDDWLVYGPERDQWLATWRGPRRSVAGRLLEFVGAPPTCVDLGTTGDWIFNSHYTRRRAADAGVAPRSASVIHPGIAAPFLSAAPVKEWGWRLLYVGRLDRQKGVDTAIRALAALPPAATLEIWGTGETRYVNEMRALASQLAVGHRVAFRGFANSTSLPSIYAAADAVLFPVRWQEPFGLVPLEAMGVGRSVVTTSGGGTAEYLRDNDNALVFAADDHNGLARCVARLADDRGLRDRLRAGGLRTAAGFPASSFAQATVRQIVAGA